MAQLPAAQCPNPDLHGNPFRYCPTCDWIEDAKSVEPPKAPKATLPPSIGRIVLYKLAETDIARIRDQRNTAHTVANAVWTGDVFPALVVRTWDTSVQLQVFLDGPDTYWATSVSEGDGERQWSWPPRV